MAKATDKRITKKGVYRKSELPKAIIDGEMNYEQVCKIIDNQMIENNGQDKIIQVGSIVKSTNYATKKDYWAVVMAIINDERLLCVKLDNNEIFSKIGELKLKHNVFGDDHNTYANVFSGIVNIDITKVEDVFEETISDTERFAIVATFSNFMLGFWHMKDGYYYIDCPYVKNPIFTLAFGMVNIDEAHNMENQAVINLTKRREAENDRKTSEKIRKMPKVKKTDTLTLDLLTDLGVYGINVKNRIDAIYHVMDNYLTKNGELSINAVYNALFNGAKMVRSYSCKNALTKEQFARILMDDDSNIPLSLKNRVQCIFFGRKKEYIDIDSKIINDAAEYRKCHTTLDTVKYLQDKYDYDDYTARNITTLAIKRKKTRLSSIKRTRTTQYSKSYLDRAMEILNNKIVKSFDRYDDVRDAIVNNIDNISKIVSFSETLVIDSNDPLLDIVVLNILFRVYNNSYGFVFFDNNRYKHLVKYLNNSTVQDIRARFIIDKANFYLSTYYTIKLYAHYIGSNNTKERKAIVDVVDGKKISTKDIYPPMCAYVHSVISPSTAIKKTICKFAGISDKTNIDNFYKFMRTTDVTFENALMSK